MITSLDNNQENIEPDNRKELEVRKLQIIVQYGATYFETLEEVL